MSKLDYSHLSDEQLVEKIRDEAKNGLYSLLYARYFPKVKDKCYSFLKNRSQSEEFANDILSKAFEKLDSFQGKALFSSWLYSISYHTIIDYLRKKKQLHYPQWNKNNELPEVIDESDAEMNELSYDRLLEIFEKIHPEEKALLLMKYQDLLSLKEIAKSLKISEDAVKMRLKRARTRVIYLYFKTFESD
jgi:RNA polymerase sigma factor (sigma-70 family)